MKLNDPTQSVNLLTSDIKQVKPYLLELFTLSKQPLSFEDILTLSSERLPAPAHFKLPFGWALYELIQEGKVRYITSISHLQKDSPSYHDFHLFCNSSLFFI